MLYEYSNLFKGVDDELNQIQGGKECIIHEDILVIFDELN